MPDLSCSVYVNTLPVAPAPPFTGLFLEPGRRSGFLPNGWRQTELSPLYYMPLGIGYMGIGYCTVVDGTLPFWCRLRYK